MTTGDELAGGPSGRRVQRPLVVLALLVVGRLLASTAIQGEPAAPVRTAPSSTPSPSVTAWAAGTVTLLPPLCGTTTAQPDCPQTTPEGVYESELTGLNVEHPFTFRRPAGWTISMLQYGNGLDLRSAADAAGFSLLLSPRPVTIGSKDAATVDAHGLAASVAADPSVVATTPQRSVVGGTTAWQVDARLRPGRTATADCRVQPACAPLLLQYVSLTGQDQDVAAGAFPGRTVRLIFLDLPRQQTALVWIWDTRALATVGPVIDSVHFCAADQGCPTIANPSGRQSSPAPS